MCAEKIEELTDSNATPASSTTAKPKSAWGPALTVIILLPALSFVLSEFVLFPRLQNRFEQAVGKINMTEAASSNSPTAAPEENVTGEKTTYEIKDIMSNIGSEATGQVRYARISFVLEGQGDSFPDLMKQNEARFIDATLDVFSALSLEDLNNPNVKNIVKGQLLQRFEEAIGSKRIENLFFSQFVIK